MNNPPAIRVAKPLSIWSQAYVLGLAVIPILLTLAILPLIPCPRCGDLYRMRIGYSLLPGVSPADAAYLRKYADAEWRCRYCTENRKVCAAVRMLYWVFR
jgi:hypothetical protein